MSDRMQAVFKGRLGAFALDAAFAAPLTGITALFGPSGSGKTSVLRAIAGLNRLDGRFALGDDIWQDGRTFLPVHRRPIGYVFQEASLFPHIDVRANLDYGRRRALAGGAREEIRLDEAVSLLGLAPLLNRGPSALSGGERQRVAIGRALLSQPRLLLMDEPLAALDRAAKAEILPYLESLRDRLAVPILYVSHDIVEVERLASHMVLLERGRVRASGPLVELEADPSLPLLRLPEAGVTLAGQVIGQDAAYGLLRIAVDGGELVAPGEGTGTVRLRISAADVSLSTRQPEGSSILNILPARIIAAEAEGAAMIVVLGLGPGGEGARLLSRVTRRSWDDLALSPGAAVFAQVKGLAFAPR